MKIIVIVGPTAVGKTKLSIELAKKYNGEVINGDSTQVYKELNIATAKVTKEEMENIKHHLLDIRELEEPYTVYDFKKDAQKLIEKIKNDGKTPIIVGGTGLYITSLLYDYQFEEEKSVKVEPNYDLLLKLDPETKIHKNNKKRIERYLSYYKSTGKKLNEKELSKEMKYDAIVIGLTTDRSILYDRINKRVDNMIDNGLLKEAKYIYDLNIRSKAVMTPIGYKELFKYFDNEITLEEAIEKIKQNSRHYAKRQYTWFNNKMNVKWFDVDFENFDNTVKNVEEYIESMI